MQHFSKNICQLALEKYIHILFWAEKNFYWLRSHVWMITDGGPKQASTSFYRHHTTPEEKLIFLWKPQQQRIKPVNTQDYEDPQPLTQSHSILNIVYFTPSQNSWLFLGRLQGFSSKMNYVYKPSLSSPSNINSVHKVLNDDDFYMGIFSTVLGLWILDSASHVTHRYTWHLSFSSNTKKKSIFTDISTILFKSGFSNCTTGQQEVSPW